MEKQQKRTAQFVIYRMESVQALRGIAALFVVCQHICFLQRGSFGVDLFFLISGFVVMLSTERSTEHFFGKRMVRIMPIYCSLSLLVWWGVSFFPQWFENTKGGILNLLRSCFFIPFSQYGVMQPLVRVGWTINYEVMFYVLFMLSMKISIRFRALFCSGMLAVLALIGALFPKLPGPFAFWTDSIILEFAIGMGLFYVVRVMFGLLCGQRVKAEPVKEAAQEEGQAEPVKEAIQEEGQAEPVKEAIQEEAQTQPAKEAIQEEAQTQPVKEAVREEVQTQPAKAVIQKVRKKGPDGEVAKENAQRKAKERRACLIWYTVLAIVSTAVFYYEWKSYEMPTVCRLPEIIRWGLPSVGLFLLFVAAGMRVHMPRLLIKIGDMSFSLYMLHYYPMQLLNRILKHTTTPTVPQVLITLAVVAVVLIMSWISYRLVEKKMGDQLRRDFLGKPSYDDFNPDNYPFIIL